MAIYKEDIVDIELANGYIYRSYMNHSIGYGDELANRFGIRAFRNGEPETLSGTCSGYFIRADGSTVVIADGVISGNVAYVTLPQACYAVEGNFTLAIKISGINETGTMRIVDGTVNLTSTSTIVDPGDIIPTIDNLIEAINTAVASIPLEYSALSSGFSNESLSVGSPFESGNLLLTKGLFDINVYNPAAGYVNEYPYRISSRRAITFAFYATLIIASGFRIYPYLYVNGSWQGQDWYTESYNIPPDTPFYCQIARETEDTGETADVSEFLSKVVVKDGFYDIQTTEYNGIKESLTYRFCNWEPGGWNSAIGGAPEKEPFTGIRIRSRNLIPKPHRIKVNIKQADTRVVVFLADGEGNYTGINFDDKNPGYYEHDTYAQTTAKYVFMTVVFSSAEEIPDSLDDYFIVEFCNNSGLVEGKNVLIYQFGGAGNDWCFVRTPSGYDSMRKKPYPFVICNHGNGWVMDGTIQKANWTKRTMYVPTNDSDYIADPTEYNGTSDSSLWYSNPTIEALLTAGYIVCGCENYGDALYGNNNCRNACVDFFNHMVRTYNVEDRCYMIGASNGALTSLNAAYLLQGKVKAMILQYPLTCLVNQYENYSSHRAGIRAAYGISNSSITPEALAKAVATHDPLTTDVVDGIKVGAFPPTKLYYSPDDAVVDCDYNALALAAMLDGSNKVVQTVQCSGEHGDHSHFAPADYVAWFNAN